MANLMLRGSAYWFPNGTATLALTNLVRTPMFGFPPNQAFTIGRVDIGTDRMYPFNFRGGLITIGPGAKRDMVFSHSANLIFTKGRLTIGSTTIPAVGALCEFAIWGTGAPGDPKDVYVHSSTSGISAHTGSPWTRHSAVISVPSNARYMGVGGKFLAMPGTGIHRNQHVKKVMLEKAVIGGTYPTTFSESREVQVQIRPDRLNYSLNPNFWIDATSWSLLTRTANTASPSGFSGNAPVTAASSISFNHVVPTLFAGRTYLVKPVMTTDGGGLTATVSAVSGATILYKSPKDIQPNPSNHVMFIRPTTTGSVTITYQIFNNTAATVNVRVYSMLVEETLNPSSTPFDGNSGGDYLWEGIVGFSRSYYYKNRLERYAAILRVLADNVPMGVGIADPKFGVLPNY